MRRQHRRPTPNSSLNHRTNNESRPDNRIWTKKRAIRDTPRGRSSAVEQTLPKPRTSGSSAGGTGTYPNDDYKARKLAKAEGLKILGSVGLLEAFYARGYLTDLRACFRRLIDQRLLNRRLRTLGLPRSNPLRKKFPGKQTQKAADLFSSRIGWKRAFGIASP